MLSGWRVRPVPPPDATEKYFLPFSTHSFLYVPAHVEMMGLIGMGNNPMVGATVAVAVGIEEAAKAGKF